MSRETGERYHCESCGAELVYARPCPCGDNMQHAEICCGKQMTKGAVKSAGPPRSTTADY